MSAQLNLAAMLDSIDQGIGLGVEIPGAITNNLSDKIELRPYQIRALERLIFYRDKYKQRVDPNHLLFHMATGSGKTVIMAASILYLFEQGYRNFLFFVNSTQIIEKTKANFMSPGSTKYLFRQPIRIADKAIDVRAVDTFDGADAESINIHFTTIQGLHSRMNDPRENAVTYEDFENRKIVLISDEAHHLNAETKSRLGTTEEAVKQSWESTVSRIFEAGSENVLLEFTATANLGHPAVEEKYRNKILFDYHLREFRNDGYSKDIELRQADLPPRERMLQAVVLSQYRRKLAEAHGTHCKPVILMKSRKISESEENEEAFHALVQSVDSSMLTTLQARSGDDPTLSEAFSYVFGERALAPEDFANEIRVDFAPEKVANVNRQADLEQRQIELNSLEDIDNEIRVVFAVDKLNEGWDVLNLFDIVRLYNTRDGRRNKVGKTTTQEAQLIGRGARYFPFSDPRDTDAANQRRKYDADANHRLRLLEQLYYHCSHNPKYIQDIRRALRETGMLDDTARTVDLKVKADFKSTRLFKGGHIWLNERIKDSRDQANALGYYADRREFEYPRLLTGRTSEVSAFGGGEDGGLPAKEDLVTRTLALSAFGEPVGRFAIDSNDFYHFARLRSYFPHLKSIREFLLSEEFLGSISVKVTGPTESVKDMTSREKVEIVQFLLHEIEKGIRRASVDYTGSRKFRPHAVKALVVDKKLKISVQGERGRSWKDSEIQGLSMIDLGSKEWYVYNDSYGTEQEKEFIRYVHEKSDRLNELYDSFYLIRNEKLFQLYSFDEGRPFEPDFVMFLQRKGEASTDILQVFIEPKGEYLIKEDQWKEDFLMQLKEEAKIETLFQGRDYAVYGLPFFNNAQAHKRAFDREFGELLFEQTAD